MAAQAVIVGESFGSFEIFLYHSQESYNCGMHFKFLAALAWCSTSCAVQEVGSDEIQKLIRNLGSDNVDERTQAVLELRKRGKAARGAVEAASHDSDAEVAARARSLLEVLDCLERVRPALRKRIPTIDAILISGPAETCAAILIESARAKESGGTHETYGGLEAADLDVLARPAIRSARTAECRMRLCRALEQWGLSSAAKDLGAYLQDPSIAEFVIRTLGRLGNPECVPNVVPFLSCSNGRLRSAAAEALVGMKAREGLLDRLPGLLRSDDPSLRVQAAEWCGEHGGTSTVNQLQGMLRDNESEVRRAVVVALAQLGSRESASAILEILKGPTGPGQREAANAIAWLEARDLIPSLIRLLEDPSRSVSAEAAYALGYLRAQEAVGPLVGLLGHRDSYLRERALVALGCIGDSASTAHLIDKLSDPVPSVVLTAMDALKNADGLDASDDLAKLLTFDQKPDVRRGIQSKALELMVWFSHIKHLDKVVELLDDEDDFVRKAAIDALGRLGAAQERIRETLRSIARQEPFHRDAVLALVRLGDEGVLASALGLMDADEPSDLESSRTGSLLKAEILMALNGYQDPRAYKRLSRIKVRRLAAWSSKSTLQEVIGKVIADHGLVLQVDDSATTSLSHQFPRYPLCSLTITYLSEFISRESGCVLLLDGDTCKVVSKEKAQTYWTAWLKGKLNR